MAHEHLKGRPPGSLRKRNPRSTPPCSLYLVITCSWESSCSLSILLAMMKQASLLICLSTSGSSMETVGTRRQTVLSGGASFFGLPACAYRASLHKVKVATSQEGFPFIASFHADSASFSHEKERTERCQSFFSHFSCVFFAFFCICSFAASKRA